MAPSGDSDAPPPGHKTLHVWSKTVEPGAAPDGSPAPGPPTISAAVASIRTDDFANVASTPCARNGFLAGIASGAGVGGLKFVLRGNAIKAANWAVGAFLLGSTLSYEYCQYRRRVEKMQMKRHIEVVSENRREQARRLAEERKEQLLLDKDTQAAAKPWYKLW